MLFLWSSFHIKCWFSEIILIFRFHDFNSWVLFHSVCDVIRASSNELQSIDSVHTFISQTVTTSEVVGFLGGNDHPKVGSDFLCRHPHTHENTSFDLSTTKVGSYSLVDDEFEEEKLKRKESGEPTVVYFPMLPGQSLATDHDQNWRA